MKFNRYTNYLEVEYGDKQGDYARALGYVDEDNILHIYDLWVDEPLRKTGIARKLIAYFQRSSGAKGVVADNILKSAEGFWEHLGIGGTSFGA